VGRGSLGPGWSDLRAVGGDRLQSRRGGDPGGGSFRSCVDAQVAASGDQYDVAGLQCGSQAVQRHVQLAGEDEQNLFAGGAVSHTLQVGRDRELPCAQLAAAARD